MASSTTTSQPKIQVNNLTYSFVNQALGVRNVSLSLPARSRTLLVGANGAGKTTLLRLLAGKILAPRGSIKVSGVDPFSEGLEGVTYLGPEWVQNPVVRTDMGVGELMASVGGDAYPQRRDELLRVLDVDVGWRMHAVSDGERRRVQLAMGLVRPWDALLLDEVTVDLDVLSRFDFLAWLRRETERRDATVVYATHILDNMAGWPTHLVHMHLGTVRECGPVARLLDGLAAREEDEAEGEGEGEAKNTDGLVVSSRAARSGPRNSTLGELVLMWLRKDLEDRGPRNCYSTESGSRNYFEGRWGGYGDEAGKRLARP